jgi:hypothetical protein
MDATKLILGGIAIIIGLVLLPVVAGFVYGASHEFNQTALPHHYIDNTDVTGVAGLTSLLSLVLYGFTFGLVGIGVGLIWIGFKSK